MRYLLATDAPLPVTIVAKAALPGEEVVVLATDRNFARRMRRRGLRVVLGDLERETTWRRAGLDDDDAVVVLALSDEARALAAVRHVSAAHVDCPIVIVDSDHDDPNEEDDLARALAEFRNVERVQLTEILRAPFQAKFASALVRRRVHQYRDHFKDADRILILLHDEPDPDGIAAALALRALLGRNRQTAIIGTFKLPTRPENLRLVELLGVDLRQVGEGDLAGFGRLAVVDTQPHIFGGKVPHADLVIDHHPLRSGYTATFKDIRTSYGATVSLLLDYMIRFGMPVSERIATAAVYAIKTDTWTFRRGTVPHDVAIFAHVYPRADQSTLRRIEMDGFTLETLRLIGSVAERSELVGNFLFAHVGEVPRDDFVPTAADFLLGVAEAHWTAVSGVLGDTLTISVRNLGYQRSAGELVQQVYGSMGSAGGHRAAAKAVLPLAKVHERFGDPAAPGFATKLFKPLREAAGLSA